MSVYARPELACDIARADRRAAASAGRRDNPMPQTRDGGCGDVDAVPGRAGEGDDPVGVGHPPGHAADDTSRHDDADAASARVAGVDRVPGRGNPATGGRLRQRDAAVTALRERQPLARSGERVHDTDLVERDVERLARGAECLRLPDQVGAGEHPAARAGAGAVRHVLPEMVLPTPGMLAEGFRHADHE